MNTKNICKKMTRQIVLLIKTDINTKEYHSVTKKNIHTLKVVVFIINTIKGLVFLIMFLIIITIDVLKKMINQKYRRQT